MLIKYTEQEATKSQSETRYKPFLALVSVAKLVQEL